MLLLLSTVFMGGGVARQTVSYLSGRVTDETGRGVSGVVVNDGVNFTATDEGGRWALFTDTLSGKFISISTPADFRLPESGGIACGYYVSVAEAVAAGGHDFVLERRGDRCDAFSYIAISDPQIGGASDLRRWQTETLPDVCRTADSLGRRGEVVGITLGDLVFDNMKMYDGYAKSVTNTGMTLFHCIGNHDFDGRYSSLDNMRLGTAVYAEMEYNRRFGPADYSFNIGKAHVITMKNIDYKGGGLYVERMSERQLEWLANDLKYVPRGSLVILNMHAAGWNGAGGRGNMRNAGRLAEVLRGYDVHVFCGHTHFFQNVEVNERLYQHNVGAACGAWWSGHVNRCGAPNGYLIVSVDGTKVAWHYKPTGQPATRQLRVYGMRAQGSQAGWVVANVWDYDGKCTVEWYEDGRRMGPMERFTAIDPAYAESCARLMPDSETPHLFRCCPSDGAREVRVVFTNRFGEVFSAVAGC